MIIITGVPRSGKTTFADIVGGKVYHSDDLKMKDWSLQSDILAHLINTYRYDYDIMEGVAMVRALRKWLQWNKGNNDSPAKIIMWFPKELVSLTPGQLSMAKGCRTIWKEIESELRNRCDVITNEFLK